MKRQKLFKKIAEEIEYRVIEQIEDYGECGSIKYDDMEVEIMGHLVVCEVEADYPEPRLVNWGDRFTPPEYREYDVEIDSISVEILGKNEYEPAHPNLDSKVNELLNQI